MKGKVTKDIFLKVGHGVMRIPREAEDKEQESPENFAASADKAETEETLKKKICK